MNNSLSKLVFWSFALLLSFSIPVAVAAEFQDGTHYRRLASPVPTATNDKVEVVELFWYGCPHCYSLEPAIERWVENKPENIEFVRLPAVLNRNWELGARAFHTAEALGVLNEIHGSLMAAFHTPGRPMRNEADLAEFFATQGIDKDTFHKVFRSFDVETRLRRSQQQVRRYGIHGVPSFVVNGKYETTLSMAGSQARLFEVIEYLVSKESEQG